MTTPAKLWTGFGTLGAILVLVVVPMLLWVRAFQKELDRIDSLAAPRNEAAQVIEICLNGFGSAVSNYLLNAEPGQRDRVRRESAGYRRRKADYDRLATNERHTELGTELDVRVAEYLALGGELISAKDAGEPEPDDVRRFTELQASLDRFLDDELQTLTTEELLPRRQQLLGTVRRIETVIVGLLILGLLVAALSSYLVAKGIIRTEETLRVTLSSIGDGVITTDTEGCVTSLNPIAENLTGWTHHEAKGRPLDEVFRVLGESTRALVANPAIRALREGVIVGPANHSILVSRDGSQRPIDDSAAPIRDAQGQTVGCVLVFRDVTARRRADRELRASEARFSLLAEAIPQLVWMARADGHITWYNGRWYEYTGTTPREMEGWGWQSVHDPDVLPRVLERWKRSIATGEPFDMVFPLKRADGRFRPFLTRVTAVRNSGGEVVQWFGTNTEITEQKRLEEELRRTAARLSESDRRKDQFLAVLAHELRNPLASVRTGLEVMRLASGDSASIEEVRGMMERQTQLLVSLVDDLLDVSRITRGKVELKRARVDLRQVIERALDGVRSSVRDAGLDLTVAFPDAPIPLDADPIRLAQVFANLLHNAVKYTPRGGRIWMSAERLEEEALVVVRDTGVGIPPEMQQRVFDMFAQLDASVEKDHSGLGIGLTLVRSLVDMHGGRVEVRSEGAGHGSEFRVWLPVAAGPPALETPPEKGEEATGGAEARRVLIVDDNRAAAETLRLVLTMAGHEVRVAYDGEEGLAAAAGFRPEVVLMDLGMPRMDGYEAAQRLREQPGGREILLIALSGWGQLHDKARTSKAGFDHHLVKPAEPALLRALLAEWPRRSP